MKAKTDMEFYVVGLRVPAKFLQKTLLPSPLPLCQTHRLLLKQDKCCIWYILIKIMYAHVMFLSIFILRILSYLNSRAITSEHNDDLLKITSTSAKLSCLFQTFGVMMVVLSHLVDFSVTVFVYRWRQQMSQNTDIIIPLSQMILF